MLTATQIGLLLLSALAAHVAPACGRAFKHGGPSDGDESKAISRPDFRPGFAPGVPAAPRREASGRPRLAHPDIPGHLADLLVVERVAGELQGQLDLAVVVALVPHHVLQQQDRVVVVQVHRAV
jgi:hypothetical protein